MILFIVIVILLIGMILCMDADKDPHDWEYRNPADRTCKICGQHEMEECWAWDYQRRGLGAGGWWEIYKPGDMTKHEKKNWLSITIGSK